MPTVGAVLHQWGGINSFIFNVSHMEYRKNISAVSAHYRCNISELPTDRLMLHS
jgi:hypothetical protein